MPETMGGGGAFFDMDRDGYLDIVLVNGTDWTPERDQPRSTMEFYQNMRDGTFRESRKRVGLDIQMQGMGVAVGDFDNDGFDDLYITGVGGNRLLRNVDGKRLKDVTQASGTGCSGWSASAAWLDYDSDGLLDLFVCRYVKWSTDTDLFCGSGEKVYCRPQDYPGTTCVLYHNEGNGRFTDASAKSGLSRHVTKALGVCTLDANRDHRIDIIVAADSEPNLLVINQGNGTFRESGFEAGIALDPAGKARAGMGIDAMFLPDAKTIAIGISNFAFEGIALFEAANEKGSFAEISKQSGVHDSSFALVGFGLVFADFDLDGLQDMAVANGHVLDTIAKTEPGQTFAQPMLILKNTGKFNFSDVSDGAGPGVTGKTVGRALCRGDFDNDGRIDLLVVANSGRPRLLRNVSNTSNHWLSVRLEGVSSNRYAYGAEIEIDTSTGVRRARVASGSSYLASSSSIVTFGLGADENALQITVHWPGGKSESWPTTRGDRTITLRQGDSPSFEGL